MQTISQSEYEQGILQRQPLKGVPFTLSAGRAMETADAQARAIECPAILKVSHQAKCSKEGVDRPLGKNNEQTGQK